MDKKVCSYCGKEKTETQFRKYYQGSSAGKLYNYCKECEKIENRRKYLIKMGETNSSEYNAICTLYNKRLEAGLQVPRSFNNTSVDVTSLVMKQLQDLTTEE